MTRTRESESFYWLGPSPVFYHLFISSRAHLIWILILYLAHIFLVDLYAMVIGKCGMASLYENFYVQNVWGWTFWILHGLFWKFQELGNKMQGFQWKVLNFAVLVIGDFSDLLVFKNLPCLRKWRYRNFFLRNCSSGCVLYTVKFSEIHTASHYSWF